MLGWRFIKFSGIIFEKVAISETSPNGIPECLQHFYLRADYSVIDIPPGILHQASANTLPDLDVQQVHLSALFEKYGAPAVVMSAAQKDLSDFEYDLERQLLSWSNTGESRRTETDVLSPNGVELFQESLIDLLD